MTTVNKAPATLVIKTVIVQAGSGGTAYNEQDSSASSVVVLAATSYMRLTNGAGGQTATLPAVSSVPNGTPIEVRDCGYGAENNPHTVIPAGSDRISDQTANDSSIAIDQNGGSIRLRAVTSNSTWERVS